jgi:hypothetical protein
LGRTGSGHSFGKQQYGTRRIELDLEGRSSTGEVALDALLDLIEWCRSERSSLQKQLCALKSGKFRIGENTGTGSIERITGSISELDQILAAYERSAQALRSAQ